MSISVTPTFHDRVVKINGKFLRTATLVITGLTAASANTIPHGLPGTPVMYSLRPGANGLWGETQVADGTNFYITVGTGGATGGTIDAFY